MLRRRRALRAGAALTGAAAVMIALIPVLAKSPASIRSAVVQRPPHRHSQPYAGTTLVHLVAYSGSQLSNYYTVKEIPLGWVIQGSKQSSPYALVIAPANDPDKDPESFLGKVVVSWQDFAGTAADGQLVKVNGRPGYYQANAGDNTQMLMFEDGAGRWLEVQSPATLRWTKSQLVTFAAGVTVLPGAQQSHG